jgi:hypothetical protein
LVCESFVACGNPPDVNIAAARTEECDEPPREAETLQAFARACELATNIDFPDFDCDQGTAVPETHLSGSGYPDQLCDRPNVLNHQCDPGSRFQVVKQTNDAIVVGHCRKKGGADHRYGDIAAIQYNQVNGATCFYQALDDSSNLSNTVTAPIKGNGPGQFPWLSPANTAGIQCVKCHDNGPFVRSPYLAQLNGEGKNRLPGTNSGTGPWDRRFTWNKTLPYTFVGADFQSWKVYSLSVTGTGSLCTGCHRMGISSVASSFIDRNGTALAFGSEATAMTQLHKNPHSADSPIWMTPGQITYSTANETEAHAMRACAAAIVAKQNDPSKPSPPSGCNFVQYGHGNTCRAGAVRGVVNGATQSTPTSDRVDTTVDAGSCASGDCPIGFCYWRTLHGPFWQTTSSTVPIGDPGYRGSFVRIFADVGAWKIRAFSDPTGGTPSAPPGGTFECTVFNEIAKVPDANNCGSGFASIVDKDGSVLSDSIKVGTTISVYPLTGYIGNVAQTFAIRATGDQLLASEKGGAVTLSQKHDANPPIPHKPGPLAGETWTSGCNAWSPDYIVKDVYTDTDIELVGFPQSKDARCYITGVSGGWSSTRNAGKDQPFAEIYSGPGKDIRLRVSPTMPTEAKDRVGAFASCIRLK